MMPVVDPEAIMEALLTRLVTSLGSALKTGTRRDLTFADFTKEQQPAMTLVSESGAGERPANCPTIWTREAMISFYAKDPVDKTKTVETTLHGLIKGVNMALQRQPNEFNDDDIGTNFGGLVSKCYAYDDRLHLGISEGQAAATMKIRIVVNETA